VHTRLALNTPSLPDISSTSETPVRVSPSTFAGLEELGNLP